MRREAEQKIWKAGNLSDYEKTSLLTLFSIYTGLHYPNQAAEFFRRRRRFMIESPIYELIKREGLQEGKRKGLQEGKRKGLQEGKRKGLQEGKLETARRMLARGLDLPTVLECTGLTEDDLRAHEIV